MTQPVLLACVVPGAAVAAALRPIRHGRPSAVRDAVAAGGGASASARRAGATRRRWTSCGRAPRDAEALVAVADRRAPARAGRCSSRSSAGRRRVGHARWRSVTRVGAARPGDRAAWRGTTAVSGRRRVQDADGERRRRAVRAAAAPRARWSARTRGAPLAAGEVLVARGRGDCPGGPGRRRGEGGGARRRARGLGRGPRLGQRPRRRRGADHAVASARGLQRRACSRPAWSRCCWAAAGDSMIKESIDERMHGGGRLLRRRLALLVGRGGGQRPRRQGADDYDAGAASATCRRRAPSRPADAADQRLDGRALRRSARAPRQRSGDGARGRERDRLGQRRFGARQEQQRLRVA